jgi:selenium-binding protein 1
MTSNPKFQSRPALLRLCLWILLLTAAAFSADHGRDDNHARPEKTLYVWASDQARLAPDFVAVINFDEDSDDYGKVIRTVPIPIPGNTNNESHHCHLSADKNVLACGGLLSLLSGQNSIFFFDVSNARHPRFMFSTNASQSSITDDFLPLEHGGFLVTQMGSAMGGAPGRLAEFDRNLKLIEEWPVNPAMDGFNPHGISVRPDLNLMVTADFILPASTLNVVPGDPVLRGAIRVWDFESREILRTIQIPSAVGTMDVKMIPGDPQGRAITAGMFDGLIYLVDTIGGTAQVVFDCESIVPHVEVPVRGGMTQLLAITSTGDRLLFGSFQAGQVGMLDITNPEMPVQSGIVSFGQDAGPHSLILTDDDKRLVVANYFLNEDSFGKIHFEGDHQVHVVKVFKDHLRVDRRFDSNFNTAFATGPARPHGLAVK